MVQDNCGNTNTEEWSRPFFNFISPEKASFDRSVLYQISFLDVTRLLRKYHIFPRGSLFDFSYISLELKRRLFGGLLLIHDSQILVYTAVKGFSYFLIYLASTFGPDGPLSSTDDYRHKNKQRKLQKVKVKDKLEYNLMLILVAPPGSSSPR